MLVRPHCGEMQMEHIPGWRERAMLQSLKPEAVRFPPKTTEPQKRQLVASVVPPLFDACLSMAVFPHRLSMGVQKHSMRSMMTSLAVRSEEEIDSVFFSKRGSGRECGGEERKIRLTAKESASSSKWSENEGISSYAEAAVMFEGATDAVERENELLCKQWPEGDIPFRPGWPFRMKCAPWRECRAPLARSRRNRRVERPAARFLRERDL